MTSLKNEIIISFIDGAKCEIKGPLKQNYLVKFYNNNTKELIWEDTISNNMWTSPGYKSYTEWRIEIWEGNNKIYDYTLDLTDQRVYIHLESKSVGDTIAWFPYVEEFRKKHNCKVICSTFHNSWFASKYPKIEFVEPGTNVGDIKTSYSIGWFYENNEPNSTIHKFNFLYHPLQKTASDILGLNFKEIKPNISIPPKSPSIKEKYVTLSIQSTAQSKYWNHKEGWQQVVDFLVKQGYKVILVDQHKTFGIKEFINSPPQGVIDYTNKSLSEVSHFIKNAQFHIGISSGLSWLAWVLNTPVVMISSFTKPWFEFQSNCVRIYNDTSKSGYFNTHRLDPSNWNWYPFKEIKSMNDWHKIENITPEQVINDIKQLI